MVRRGDGQATRGSRVRGALAATVEAGVLALSIATLLGAALDLVRPGSAIHPRFLGSTGLRGLDTAIAAAFATLALLPAPLLVRAPRMSRLLSVVLGATVTGLALSALCRHVAALGDGRLVAAGWAPPVTLVALALVVPWTIAVARRARPTPRHRLVARLGPIAAAGVVLVAAQLAAVGATDYRGRADAILVLGAKVHADGTASGSLLDRTRTACALYRDGLAPTLVLSGGRDCAAAASEPEVMRRIALGEGVPDEAILLDETGVDTAASIRCVAALAHAKGWGRVLVVSHDYHLARVRLLADREGLAVRTVPATETCPGGWKIPAFARELAAYVATWVLLD